MDDLIAIAQLRELLELEPEPLTHRTPHEARSILREAGLSVDAAARVMDVSWRSVQSWVSGEHAPSHQHAARWQALLAVLDRSNAMRGQKLLAGVSRLLEIVRTTPVPQVEELAA